MQPLALMPWIQVVASLFAGGGLAALILSVAKFRKIDAETTRVQMGTALSLIGPLEQLVERYRHELERCHEHNKQLREQLKQRGASS